MEDDEIKGGSSGSAREAAKSKEYADWNKKKKTNFDLPRVMYCVGSVSRVDNVIQNYYLSPFLLDVVGLKAAYVGNVLLIKQLWDALTDPFVGYLSDNTTSSFGRRKPYIFFAAPFLWATWILSWTDFTAIESQGLIMLYFIVVLLVFSLANTLQTVCGCGCGYGCGCGCGCGYGCGYGCGVGVYVCICVFMCACVSVSVRSMDFVMFVRVCETGRSCSQLT